MEKENILSTAIYIRVSTEEQAKEGFSINAQKQKLTQYALARDWKIFDYFIDDGISGKNIKDRPEVNRMLQAVESGRVDNVLVYKIDRLTRSTKNLIELVDLFNYKNCAFNSLCESIDTSSATGRMFLKIVGIFAEFERENLAERVSFGYEQKTREGNYTNTNGVYGYDYIQGTGELVINQNEKEIIKEIFNTYLSGISMNKVAKKLREDGIPTKRGGSWCTATIESILTNPLYIGKVRYAVQSNHKKESFEAEGHHEPILDANIFDKVQDTVSKRKKYHQRHYAKENTYFLGSLFCSKCGAKLGSTQHKRYAEGNLYVNYYDYNTKEGKCDCHTISQNRVEEVFGQYIENISEFKPTEKIIEKLDNNDSIDSVKKIQFLEKEKKRIEKKLDDVKSLFLQDKISFQDYQTFDDELRKSLSQVNEDLQAWQDTQTECENEEINFNSIKDIVKSLKNNWVELTKDEKREFLYKFIDRIEIYSDGKNVSIFDCKFAEYA